ncbi:IS4 family transposase [Butyrivibrio sp. VCB2006]|uniref:IS4 family transposase n=1 Tax=Butyrivibrio sp. VCB2006 TaxID=1280679 RepID=UPI00041F1414|nr:transposase [Butyrivibrio sp. VCB2006]
MSKIISQNDFDSKQNADSIRIFFERFRISSILKASNVRKTKGIAPAQILMYAFALVFKNKSMYMDMLLGSNTATFAKDTYYRFMKSISINWIRFTTLLASNICRDVIAPATSEDRVNALIVDDSIFSRACSKKVEMLSKIYDHANKKFLYGFRMLTLGWTDGNTFLPVNQILLSSSNENKLISSNDVDRRSNGFKRRKLSVMKGTDAMIELIKEARKAMIPADYVLFDTWFASPKTLTAVERLGYDVIAMIKRSDKMSFIYRGGKYTLKELYKMNRKRRGRSKYLLSLVVEIQKDDRKIPVKIVFVRNRSNRKDYLCLISTDYNIDEEEMIRIYSKRWKIEVFFKVCKSYLKLANECRSLSYDAMTAHTAVVFARYMMLAVDNRESEDPRTLGELFTYFVDELADVTFVQAFRMIMELFSDMMAERFELGEEEISSMIDTFISALTPSMQRQLQVS